MEIIFKQVLLKQMSLSFLFFADVFILSKDSAFTLTNASARHTFEKKLRHLSVHFLGWKKKTNNRFSCTLVKEVWNYANIVLIFMVGFYLTTEIA